MNRAPGLLRWFPTLILEKPLETFAAYNDHLRDKAYALRDQLPEPCTDWRCDTFNTLENWQWEDDPDPLIRQMALQAIDEVYDFSLEFGVNKPITKYRCVDFWFNIAGPGAYQEFHQHANSHFSLVYYVRTPQRSGDIVFQNPISQLDMFCLPVEKFNANSYRSCNYSPKEGNMLLFRSNISHMVEKNLSGEDRISIAMNFRIDF